MSSPAVNQSQAIGGIDQNRVNLNNKARAIVEAQQAQQQQEQAEKTEQERRLLKAEELKKLRSSINHKRKEGKETASLNEVVEGRIYNLVYQIDKAKTPEEKRDLISKISDLTGGYIEYSKSLGNQTIRKNTGSGVERKVVSGTEAMFGEGFDSKSQPDQLQTIIENAYNSEANRRARQNKVHDISSVAGRLEYASKYNEDPANIKIVDKHGRESSLSNTGLSVEAGHKVAEQIEAAKKDYEEKRSEDVFAQYKIAKEQAEASGGELKPNSFNYVTDNETGQSNISYKIQGIQQPGASIPTSSQTSYHFDNPEAQTRITYEAIQNLGRKGLDASPANIQAETGNLVNSKYKNGIAVETEASKQARADYVNQFYSYLQQGYFPKIEGGKVIFTKTETTVSEPSATGNESDVIKEMAELGWQPKTKAGPVIAGHESDLYATIEKDGQTFIQFEAIPGEKQYELKQPDPSNPFRIEKVEVKPEVLKQEIPTTTLKTGIKQVDDFFAGMGAPLANLGILGANLPLVLSRQKDEKDIQYYPELEGQAYSSIIESMKTGNLNSFGQLARDISENPSYFAGTALTSGAVWAASIVLPPLAAEKLAPVFKAVEGGIKRKPVLTAESVFRQVPYAKVENKTEINFGKEGDPLRFAYGQVEKVPVTVAETQVGKTILSTDAGQKFATSRIGSAIMNAPVREVETVRLFHRTPVTTGIKDFMTTEPRRTIGYALDEFQTARKAVPEVPTNVKLPEGYQFDVREPELKFGQFYEKEGNFVVKREPQTEVIATEEQHTLSELKEQLSTIEGQKAFHGNPTDDFLRKEAGSSTSGPAAKEVTKARLKKIGAIRQKTPPDSSKQAINERSSSTIIPSSVTDAVAQADKAAGRFYGLGGNAQSYTNKQTLSLGGKTGAERKNKKTIEDELDSFYGTDTIVYPTERRNTISNSGQKQKTDVNSKLNSITEKMSRFDQVLVPKNDLDVISKSRVNALERLGTSNRTKSIEDLIIKEQSELIDMQKIDQREESIAIEKALLTTELEIPNPERIITRLTLPDRLSDTTPNRKRAIQRSQHLEYGLTLWPNLSVERWLFGDSGLGKQAKKKGKSRKK